MVVVDDGEGMDQSINRLLFDADYRAATGFELRQRLVEGGAVAGSPPSMDSQVRAQTSWPVFRSE